MYIPNGLTVAARSKMVYGTPDFSRRAPSKRPPRPAPTIRTVGFSLVVIVGERSAVMSSETRNREEGSKKVGIRMRIEMERDE